MKRLERAKEDYKGLTGLQVYRGLKAKSSKKAVELIGSLARLMAIRDFIVELF